MKDKLLRLAPWLLVAAAASVIFCLSTEAFSSQATGALFGSWNGIARKLAHVVEYAVLFLVLRWTLGKALVKRKPVSATCLALLCAVLFAVGDEWHQSFVPSRTASMIDVLIDCVGVLLGWVLWFTVHRWMANGRNRESEKRKHT